MTLINGPYNNHEIEDIGTVTQKMSIYKKNDKSQIECGYALYEPNETRNKSFWLTNVWENAILTEVIENE